MKRIFLIMGLLLISAGIVFSISYTPFTLEVNEKKPISEIIDFKPLPQTEIIDNTCYSDHVRMICVGGCE